MSRLVLNRNGGSADEYGHLLALYRSFTGDVIEGMAVTASGTPAMNVVVAPGTARISTGTYPSSYGYMVAIDTTTGTPAGEVVTITTANGSNPRIDTIVGYIDLTVTASSGTPNNPNNMFKLAAVTGTPAATPSAPTTGAIQSAIGASNPYIILANVLVGTSVTQVTTANVTDMRTMVKPVVPAAGLPLSSIANVSDFVNNFVKSGGAVATVTGLTVSISNIVYYIAGVRYTKSSIANQVLTASKDAYIDIDTSGNITVSYSTIGAAAQTLAANSIRIAKVVTGSSSITSIVQSGVDSLNNPVDPLSVINLISTMFSNQIQSYTNSGSAGGTMNYINLGGIKLLWGQTSAQTIGGAAPASAAVSINFPSGFFSSIATAIATPGPISNTQYGGHSTSSISTTAWTLNFYITSGAAGNWGAFVLVIGV